MDNEARPYTHNLIAYISGSLIYTSSLFAFSLDHSLNNLLYPDHYHITYRIYSCKIFVSLLGIRYYTYQSEIEAMFRTYCFDGFAFWRI